MPYAFPTPVSTARLRLRTMTTSDVDDVHAYQSRPDVCAYLLFEPRTREEVAERLERNATAIVLSGDGDYWQIAIERRDHPGRVIGDVFFVIKDAANATCEIGWTLHPEHTGSGYVTEAASAVLTLAFSELRAHRAIAQLDPRNQASAAVCRRLGMRLEAHHIEDLWFRGAWSDTAVHAVLEREWAERPAGPSPA
jgi:RimJ/RimL family protein N-acetyltransferase